MAAGGGATAGRSTATMPPGDARTMPAPPVVVFMTDFAEDFTEVFGEVFIMKTNGPVGRFGKRHGYRRARDRADNAENRRLEFDYSAARRARRTNGNPPVEHRQASVDRWSGPERTRTGLLRLIWCIWSPHRDPRSDRCGHDDNHEYGQRPGGS
ncbi:hypothetical protein ACFV94_19875 [Streptomyces sp. NPDC059896]|uniref:hypothetical protein n=1 Tax=Streptomyces sp. NPDC059896 TaxID=3346993 RepID=UPI0036574ABF